MNSQLHLRHVLHSPSDVIFAPRPVLQQRRRPALSLTGDLRVSSNHPGALPAAEEPWSLTPYGLSGSTDHVPPNALLYVKLPPSAMSTVDPSAPCPFVPKLNWTLAAPPEL